MDRDCREGGERGMRPWQARWLVADCQKGGSLNALAYGFDENRGEGRRALVSACLLLNGIASYAATMLIYVCMYSFVAHFGWLDRSHL